MEQSIHAPESVLDPAASYQERKAVREELAVFDAPSYDEISVRAYYIYIETGCLPGHCRDNWHQAEQALKSENRAKPWAKQDGHHASPASYSPPGSMLSTSTGNMPSSPVPGS